MAIQESGEMYLETILVLQRTKDRIRAVDICDAMQFSKPSVSRAMAILRKNGYITTDEHGNIAFTDSGREIAETIYERHLILTEFLKDLGVEEKIASEDACRLEHHISPESFEAIKRHLQNK